MASGFHKDVGILEERLTSLLNNVNISRNLQLQDLFSSKENKLFALKCVLLEFEPDHEDKVNDMKLTELLKELSYCGMCSIVQQNPKFLESGNYSEVLAFWICLFSNLSKLQLSRSLPKKEDCVQEEESWLILENLCSEVDLTSNSTDLANISKSKEETNLDNSDGNKNLCNEVDLTSNSTDLANISKPKEETNLDNSDGNKSFEYYQLDETQPDLEKMKHLVNTFGNMCSELSHLVSVLPSKTRTPKDSTPWVQVADRTEQLSQFLSDVSTAHELTAVPRDVTHNDCYVENNELCEMITELALLSDSINHNEE